MLALKYSQHFKKDLKSFKQDKDLLLILENVLDTLIAGKILAKKTIIISYKENLLVVMSVI
jgi:mRNA-degrading endonuclease YafQ of YafQ-DinJ toxin-antitoxin module